MDSSGNITNVIDLCASVVCISLAGMLAMNMYNEAVTVGLALESCAWVAKFASTLERSIAQSLCMLRVYLCMFVVAAVVLVCSYDADALDEKALFAPPHGGCFHTVGVPYD